MKLLRRSLAAAAILLIVVYAGAIVWLVSHETRLVFEAGQPLGDLRPQPPFEQIDARGNNPSVGLAWVMRTAAAPETRPWVIFLHGNASTIGSRLNILHYERLRSLGLNVLAPEYRGYGGVGRRAFGGGARRRRARRLRSAARADVRASGADRRLRVVARFGRRRGSGLAA